MIKEENINCTVEALILASPEPVSIKRLGETTDNISPARVRQAVDDLNNIYMGCGSSFRIREVAGGYQVHILPDFEQVIKKLLFKQRTVRLSRAALETLSIVAYKQPVTKIEIEHIRGVATDGVIHNLLQRNLVIIAGRSESPGRPLLYKTSNEFLKFFGLNRLSDLPRLEEIEEMIRLAETPREQTVLDLSGKEAGSSEDVWSDEDSPNDEVDSGNGDMNESAMVATADVGDFLPEDDEVTLEDSGQPSEDDESEAGGAQSEPEAVPETDLREEIEEEAPILSIYEPLADTPPGIFGSDRPAPGDSDNGNGSSREQSSITSDESSVIRIESVEAGEDSSKE